jgi:hypothetical protein
VGRSSRLTPRFGQLEKAYHMMIPEMSTKLSVLRRHYDPPMRRGGG